MKYRIFFSLLVFWIFTPVFAENSISLSTENTKVVIAESFEVEIQVQTTNSSIQDITIPGIENFDVFSTQQSQQVQIYNEQVQNQFTLLLDLRAKNTGTYTLGPIVYGSGATVVSSEKLSLEVVPKTLSSGQKPDTLSDAVFQDELREPKNNTLLFFLIGITSLCLFGIFSFLTHRYFFPLNSKEMQDMPQTVEKTFSLQEKLLDYYTRYENQDDHSFYVGLNLILRDYFATLGVSSAHEKTYQELTLEKLIPQKLKQSFALSYFAEFEKKMDNPSARKEIFENILSHFS